MPLPSAIALRLAALACLLAAGIAAENDGIARDCGVITARLRGELIPAADESTAAAEEWLHAQRPDGTWAEIDYQDQRRGGWRTMEHLRRVLTMAKALEDPHGRLHGDNALRAGVFAGFDHWTAKDYQNPNWWNNQIGVPMSLGAIMLLLKEELSPQRLAAGLVILKHAKVGMTGQNMLWLASNQFTWASLSDDGPRMSEAITAIAHEIRISDGEGVQADLSFHQHGRCLYSGGYGMGFCIDSARWAWLVGGTRFAFDAGRLALVVAYALDGQQWMEQGDNFDYACVGREITRKGHSGRGLATCCDFLLRIEGVPRAAELALLARRIRGQAPEPAQQLSGDRMFWRSDYLSHHRPGWMISVRMVSDRLVNTDNLTNEEGYLSHCLADGATFIYRRGDEYHDIFGVWDWLRVPGTSEFDDRALFKQPVRFTGPTAFVGGASDGLYGVAAMDLARSDLDAKAHFTGKDALTAHKAWFCCDDGVVCLAAGLDTASTRPAITTIDQRLLTGAVQVAGGGQPTEVAAGDHSLSGVRWVLHDGVGYAFPEPAAVRLVNQPRSGSWWESNHVQSKATETLAVFDLEIDHGAMLHDGRYAYAILPGSDGAALAAWSTSPTEKIIANRPELQAVWQNAGDVLEAVFWRPGRLDAPNGLSIAVDQPCALILRASARGMRLALADPAHHAQAVQLDVNRHVEGPGCTWDAQRTQSRITTTLPGGDLAGSSVVMELTAP